MYTMSLKSYKKKKLKERITFFHLRFQENPVWKFFKYKINYFPIEYEWAQNRK